jgi:murein DD-endopeptidase MepM/ murein hydrolase activator NlpD
MLLRAKFMPSVTTGLLTLAAAAATWLAGCLPSGSGWGYQRFEFQPLEFPFEDSSDVERLAAFGTPNWSGTEPHNGIDLIVFQTESRSKIISPTRGTVQSIRVSENPFSDPVNQLILTVEIFVNDEWTVDLVIEPSTVTEATRTAQIDAIAMQVGSVVDVGQDIGDLLVGELGYPHLHYMIIRNGQPVCAYAHSSDAARKTFDEIAVRSGTSACYQE